MVYGKLGDKPVVVRGGGGGGGGEGAGRHSGSGLPDDSGIRTGFREFISQL